MNENELARLAELQEMKRDAAELGDTLDEDDADELRGLLERRRSENRASRMWAAWHKHDGQVWRAIDNISVPSETWYALKRDDLACRPYSVDEFIEMGIVVEQVDKPEIDDQWDVDASNKNYLPARAEASA